jgi:hypothetical protein
MARYDGVIGGGAKVLDQKRKHGQHKAVADRNSEHSDEQRKQCGSWQEFTSLQKSKQNSC